MLYHYTDRESVTEIRRDGVIKASPATLHERLAMDGKIHVTAPIVWLSSNPRVDATVAIKVAMGHRGALVGTLCRVVLPDLYAGDVGVAEYSEQKKIDFEWWRWAVYTGGLAGSLYTTWRLIDRDIPACDWLGIEVLAAIEPKSARWEPIGES